MAWWPPWNGPFVAGHPILISISLHALELARFVTFDKQIMAYSRCNEKVIHVYINQLSIDESLSNIWRKSEWVWFLVMTFWLDVCHFNIHCCVCVCVCDESLFHSFDLDDEFYSAYRLKVNYLSSLTNDCYPYLLHFIKYFFSLLLSLVYRIVNFEWSFFPPSQSQAPTTKFSILDTRFIMDFILLWIWFIHSPFPSDKHIDHCHW